MADGETRLLMLIDDEPVQSRLVGAVAAREGWRTLVAESADEALAKLDTPEGRSLGAVLLDQWVPGDDACNLIREIKTRRPTLPVLMITASTSPLLAVEAMRAGATDYLIKPVAGERLLLALRSATRPEPPRFELQPLAEKLVGTLDFDTMVGTAPPLPHRARQGGHCGARPRPRAGRGGNGHRQGNAPARDAFGKPAGQAGDARHLDRRNDGGFDRIAPVRA